MTPTLFAAITALNRLHPNLTLALAVDAGARQLGFTEPHLATDADLLEGLTQVLSMSHDHQLECIRFEPLVAIHKRLTWPDAANLLSHGAVGSDGLMRNLMRNLVLRDGTPIFIHDGAGWCAHDRHRVVRVAHAVAREMQANTTGGHQVPADHRTLAVLALALDADAPAVDIHGQIVDLTPVVVRMLARRDAPEVVTRRFPQLVAAINSFYQ